ncbi:trehalose operon repressor [Exiguobacterium sp. JMULE1]|uniref:trehalose operon repressor n=1 Tax=Exiguobacterium sp. JMULE1 TaxID=2518339 RepID=UPI00157677CB|nr:trehalose operon repressor [Exiguobacterium sp. JMULE1]NTY10758.1 trehalose operon repressor [Exiguobacterium sp. JMULE1]
MPKYVNIYHELAQRIQEGTLPAETKLPSETELMHEFEASRGTVRKAIDALQEKGFVRKHQGKGVFVLSQEAIEFQFNGIVSFSEAHRRMGRHTVETDVLSCDVLSASAELASLLHVAEGTDVTRIERIRQIDGERVIRDINHFVTALVPGLTTDIARGSIYQYIEETLGRQISYAKRKIEARPATREDQERLDLHDMTHVIVVTNDTYFYEGQHFERTESRHRLDKFQFTDIARR